MSYFYTITTIKNTKENIDIYVICILWVIVLSMQYLFFIVGENEELILNSLGISVFTFSLLLIRYFKKKIGNYLSIYIIFYILTLFFLQGQIILKPFNLLSETLLHGIFSYNIIIKATFIVQISMVVFAFAGATYSYHTVKERKDRRSYVQALYSIAVVVTLCSLPFYIVTIYERLMIAIRYGYMALYQDIGIEVVGSYTRILGNFFIPACLILVATSKQKNWIRNIALLNIIFNTIIMVSIGYRATGVFPLLSLLWVLNLKNQYKKINIKLKVTLVLLIISVFILFPIIKEIRANPELILTDFIITKTLKYGDMADYFSVISEMGGTLKTVCYTLQYISDGNDLLYGKSYLIALTAIVPNIFGSMHPTAVFGGLGDLITQKYNYNFYLQGGSFGFSFIAECIINFGIVGLIIFSYLLGKIILKIELRAIKYKSRVDIAAFSVFVMYLFFYPRAELEYLVRPLFWYTLLPVYLAKFIAMVQVKNENKNFT